MTITRVGTNSKYASGWSSAFGKGKGATAAKTPTKAAKKKAAPKKKAAKKAKK